MVLGSFPELENMFKFGKGKGDVNILHFSHKEHKLISLIFL